MEKQDGLNLAQMTNIHIVSGEGKYRVEAMAVCCGRDVTVVIGGGTAYHIGAVAMATPRPSLADPKLRSASASVLCVTGHKDDDIARSTAISLAAALDCIVTVTVGLHVDEASQQDINLMLHNLTQLVEQLGVKLTDHFQLKQFHSIR